MLRIFKRDLFLCAAITGFVILCALTWGSPFVGTSSHSVFAKSRQMKPAVMLSGAVLRNGDQLLLRDSSGILFHLDNPQSAQEFVGKSVSVNGHLEAASKTIHIDGIEPAR
jgi:hypothetical protein